MRQKTKLNMDARVIKTKAKLHDALIALLQKQSLADITVSSLCEKAGVNRTTFYVYYDNVEDCFEEITGAIVEDMRNTLYRENVHTPIPFLHVYFQTARKNQTVFRAIHSTNIHDPAIGELVSLSNEFLNVTAFVPHKNENLALTYVLSGFYGLVETWLRNGCKESDEELLYVMSQFLRK